MIGNYFWGGAAAAPYEIEQSLRFDGSSYLERTNSTDSNRHTWTLSCWVKRSSLGGGDAFFSGYENDNNRFVAKFRGSSLDDFEANEVGAGATKENRRSLAVYRDPSAWQHFVIVYDVTNATADDRMRVYINGALLTARTSDSSTYDWAGVVNGSGTDIAFGRQGYSTPLDYFDGYIAEAHLVDGTAVTDALDFGEYDDNGVWRPIRYTGSHGTQGFYLKFDPSATNGIGHDHSGNGNHFTASGFTTSGTGTDVMSDTPTNNFATINPVDQQNGTLSNGNLDLTATAYNYSTIGVTSGKYYLEYTVGTSGGSSYNFWFGARNLGHNFSGQKQVGMAMCNGGNQLNTYGVYTSTNGTVTNPTGSRPSLPATIGIKINLDDGEVEFLVNGSVNGKVTGITDFGSVPVGFFASHWTGTFSDFPCTVNFGQRAFANTVPTGYSTLSTSNLPAPDIADGSDYFQTVLYTGNGSTQSITVGDNLYQQTGSGNTWQPDWVWIKSRSAANSHGLFDAVRGVQNELNSNASDAEGTGLSGVTSFNSDGFSLGSRANENQSSATFAAWNWLGANGTSTPSGGSIASTVSANPTAGFSIVSYTGNATSGATVAHGLGVAPSMTILKSRDTTTNWYVWHAGLTQPNYQIYLNLTNAQDTSVLTFLNDKAPTSTVFELPGSGYGSNNSGVDYIAYCFAEVEGFSKFGSYTGNGSSDGPFVYCGFKPAFVMIKRTDAANDWVMKDAARSSYNAAVLDLYANTSQAEVTFNPIDFTSNGFKIRNSNASPNASGGTYVFACFASNPFGGSGVSPATAR